MSFGAACAIAAAVYVAALVQTIGGFGFALLSVSLMTLAVDPRTAVIVSTLAGTVSVGAQMRRERRHAQRPLVARFTIAAYVGMPFGLFVFESVSERVLRIALGGAIWLAVLLLASGFTVSGEHRVLEHGAGFVSGVLSTSLSTNGPPLVFALQAKQLAPDAFRGTLAWVFGLCNVGSVALFTASGRVTRAGLIGLAASLPSIALGQFTGVRLKDRFEGARFRRLVFALLVAAGASAVAAAL